MYCDMSELDRAKKVYFEYYSGKEVAPWESGPILRFLAELDMWEEAGELVRSLIDRGHHFPDGERLLITICRKRSLHWAILTALTKHGTSSKFDKLRQLLIDDLCLADGIRALASTGREADISEAHALSKANQILVKQAPTKTKQPTVCFLCTDPAYFFAALTFLSSYAVNNPALRDTLHWKLFLDKKIDVAWGRIVLDFAKKLGVPVDLIFEDEFVHSEASHLERYGLFTGGNVLSRAAYLRIYAAKFLFNTRKYKRAFYFDTDLICRGDILDFLNRDFKSKLIMARAEEATPEIQTATIRHGLVNGSYFNSGVLGIDLSNPALEDRLDHAIELAEKSLIASCFMINVH